LRINNSGDDAAGLAVANSFRSDVSTLSQGVRNANDGISTLQIIDGGLNTISSLLDRATTLATQSASDTFTGNRDILQIELNKVLTEIDRQSQNIGLGGTSSTAEGRFNKSISVFIGGGTTASSSNNQVAVDLSSSRVDKTGLSLTNLSIGTGSGSVTGGSDISAGITSAETLTFQTVGSSGALVSSTVSLSASATSSGVLDSINNDATIQAAGIKASLDSAGKLVLTSSKFFTVKSSVAGGANQTSVAGAAAAASDIAVSGGANYVSKVVSAGATAATVQTLSFTGSEIGYANSSKDVTFSAAATAILGAAAAAAAVNNDLALRSAGVFAVVDKADSTNIRFVSLKAFNLAISSDTGAVAANTNIDALQSPTAATAGTTTGGASGAQSALTAIKAAIASLGGVQGKVGAGQNNLQQAIDLASSQITNFQAAESRVRDADIAQEASNLSRLTVLQQAGVAALAQANQSSQAVLSLLR
jgi:flagellin